MWSIANHQSLFYLLNILLHLLTSSHSLPIVPSSVTESKDSIYNQLINGRDLIVHEENGVVFTRIGDYYEINDIFGLTVSLPVSQYACSILPMMQVEKLSLCITYAESLRAKMKEAEISSRSTVSDFLHATNNTRFSAQSIRIKPHQRSRRALPLIVGAVAGALGAIFIGGVSVYNTIKGMMLSNRVLEIQKSVSETNEQLQSVEVSVYTCTNSTVQLVRAFTRASENMENMRSSIEDIVKHTSRLNSFAEAQTRYNLKSHAESVYERMRNSMHRIQRNDLNIDFVGMTEQNEIIEVVFQRLQYSVPSMRESKFTFISRMLFAQTVKFVPSESKTHTNDTTGYYPEHLGNVIVTSYFTVLKNDPRDRMQVYKITNLPFFYTEGTTGEELVGLPRILGISHNGYIEWKEITEPKVCDFGEYTVCRDPPIVQTRIYNMCLEQLIATNRSFHCRTQVSLYSSPYFEKIRADLLVISTRTPINCTTRTGSHILRNVSIVHLECADTFYCDKNINFIGNKQCGTSTPYLMKTVTDDIIPITEPIRPLNISLPKVYPFADDRKLILTLEEQLKTQEKNIFETKRTNRNFEPVQKIGEFRLIVILLITLTIMIVATIIICFIYHKCKYHRQRNQSNPAIVNINHENRETTSPTKQSHNDPYGSWHDLLNAFAMNRLSNSK